MSEVNKLTAAYWPARGVTVKEALMWGLRQRQDAVGTRAALQELDELVLKLKREMGHCPYEEKANRESRIPRFGFLTSEPVAVRPKR